VRYRLAMFDFDGTLADTLLLADAHGFNRIEAGDLDTLRGSSARQVVAHLGVPAWTRPTIGIALRRLMEDVR
jgi:phosphoglycolate phosphatase